MKISPHIVGIVLAVSFIPMLASALTAEEIRTQIEALLAQIEQLQAQITEPTAKRLPGVMTKCPNLYRTLARGSRGQDVTELQDDLIAEGMLTGSATGFFGAKTEAAVKLWQSQHKVVSSGSPFTTGYGIVGARTRAAIAFKCKEKRLSVSCPIYNRPLCESGYHLVGGDIDANGCQGSPRCVNDNVVCPTVTYNACGSGYTASFTTDANGCRVRQCIPPISDTPSIRLLSPNGGEHYVSPATIQIRWTTAGLPSDLANRHPRLSFRMDEFDSTGNYGSYTASNKQVNGVSLGEAITDIGIIRGGSAQIPVALSYAAPNKFAKQFLIAELSYDRVPPQAAAAILAAQLPSNAMYSDTTDSEITVAFSTSGNTMPCFDDYQSWNIGGTWFAHGGRRSTTCLVGGPGSGTVDFSCTRPNICSNGTWLAEQQ